MGYNRSGGMLHSKRVVISSRWARVCALVFLAATHAGIVLGLPSAPRAIISGFVEESGSGARLSGVHVWLVKHRIGAVTNQFGYFSIHARESAVELAISHISYESSYLALTVQSDTSVVIKLERRILGLDELRVTAERTVESRSVQMSQHRLRIAEIASVPVILGESDILKTLQLLPGVQGGREGFSGLHVRGGQAGQNLILLDGMPVYNPTHLLGLFGIFNPYALQEVELIKGGFPARYGGRLSSVLNVLTKEGSLTGFGGAAKLGVLTSQVMIEGPVVHDRASFIVSTRRSFVDWITRWVQRGGTVYSGYFYDANFKLSHRVSPRDQLSVTGYLGQDRFTVKQRKALDESLDHDLDAALNWGNRLASVRWNRLVSNRMFASFIAGVTRYRVGTEAKRKDEWANHHEQHWYAVVLDYVTRLDLEYAFLPNQYLRVGAEHIAHQMRPDTRRMRFAGENSTVSDITYSGAPRLHMHQLSLYVEDDMQLAGGLRFNVGVRLVGILSDGALMQRVEPRLSVRVPVSADLDLGASVSRMGQAVHQLPGTSPLIPSGVWIPAMDGIAAQHGTQIALGGVWDQFGPGLEVSVEGYYRTMQGLTDYKAHRLPQQATVLGWPEIIVSGTGKSYGTEAMVRRGGQRLDGWVSYTWARTDRRFEDLNDDLEFPDTYDRRHDVSIVAHYRLTAFTTLGLTWVYGSGYPLWAPVGRFPNHTSFYGDPEYLDYGPVNALRTPATHRLDLSAQFSRRIKWGDRMFAIGLYNAYNRRNPMYIYAVQQNDRVQWKQLSLLQMIPAVSYEIRF